MKYSIYLIILLSLISQSILSVEIKIPTSLKADQNQITQWNKFASRLEKLHQYQIKNKEINIVTTSGGYAYLPNFYREEKFYDQATGLLLSRIQREIKDPHNIHLIEVFVYAKDNKLSHDYMAAFLPEHRNAPIQTLINFHFSDNELSAYRQFDASGDRIYEQCQGQYFAKPVMLSLEEHEIPNNGGVLDISDDLYLSCFNSLPAIAGKFTNPENEIALNAPSNFVDLATYENIEKKINAYTLLILKKPDYPNNYIERAKLYFNLHEFDKSVSDLSTAIQLDNNQDEAYFWRGMSLARNGQINAGITDLDIYLKRNPTSSRGYTKRGVRYIWKGDLKQAERDLKRAVQLDSNNAEAHDDLGVIFAQRGELNKAIEHFSTTIKIDPDYQKAWHNLATAEFLSLNYGPALNYINKALRLSPDSKSSLLLKGEIFMAQGETDKARKIRDKAEFLPDGNWSEQWPVK